MSCATPDRWWRPFKSTAVLPGLTEAHLENNLIEDIAPLAANPDFGEGDQVFLDGNPLGGQGLEDAFAALVARKAKVFYKN